MQKMHMDWTSFISQFTLSGTECPFFRDTIPESLSRDLKKT
ncbi:hypothetical protein MTBBW1_2090010 [Desulfamplus magnetovallimortis]|uniref:Uncharacterized protein n=1 Tax=Desulfamplus magnetovallimortis TaxID=1246637 RepID=A0A1W1HC87_9BACT|nr:hypothetical protein MTBBW1_2090010 [Desulfamplus magnetovallimortis]